MLGEIFFHLRVVLKIRERKSVFLHFPVCLVRAFCDLFYTFYHLGIYILENSFWLTFYLTLIFVNFSQENCSMKLKFTVINCSSKYSLNLPLNSFCDKLPAIPHEIFNGFYVNKIC
uniref:Uncharacterized protein n=1 Tax=Cacopsylla melanoneura TaxID=428564 RepID=A0A8D8VYN2_9HEMI